MERLKDVGDIAAGFGALGTLANLLPPLAAGFALLWYSIRMYEYGRWVKRGRRPKDRFGG